MNMSSGIGESGIAQVQRICADPHAVADPEATIAIGAETPRTGFAPGEGFTYANTNTFLLGRILEQVTGEGLGDLIEQRITEPFEMTRSRFAPDGQLEAPLTHGYTLFCPDMPQPTDTVDWSNAESWAAGGMVSTLDDIHKWGSALGAGAGLSPEMLAARYDDTAQPLERRRDRLRSRAQRAPRPRDRMPARSRPHRRRARLRHQSELVRDHRLRLRGLRQR